MSTRAIRCWAMYHNTEVTAPYLEYLEFVGHVLEEVEEGGHEACGFVEGGEDGGAVAVLRRSVGVPDFVPERRRQVLGGRALVLVQVARQKDHVVALVVESPQKEAQAFPFLGIDLRGLVLEASAEALQLALGLDVSVELEGAVGEAPFADARGARGLRDGHRRQHAPQPRPARELDTRRRRQARRAREPARQQDARHPRRTES
mmetsp:Transcript_14099/g.42653  ORF Transcript_14099/g.42653 Transcript_14099/m.42653 type:complete len:204 (-) Transcript_14099:29-640(-)